ncbi:unnamed protein product [Cylindrotheca closterium]|uniref:DUF6824 domain-containing protein n=1 Tax=Cylindrotheca closterium TaxID=2856 RepID=A0AAD2JGJ2_9STRA|nr:unnamed protein product [Cylindrotheca closterium]
MTTPVSISNPSSFCGFIWSGPRAHDQKSADRRMATDEGYEAMIGEGMKNLSFNEIQKEQEVLHGITDNVDLSESATDELLLTLTGHLNRLKKGSAYETAERKSTAHAANRDLQMAFLRANRFHPKESAEKIIKFFNMKQDLFGEESLNRDITAQDLNDDDMKALSEGYFQYSPFRDRSGRKLLLTFPGLRTTGNVRAELRVRYYAMANCVETLVDISKGVVVVNYMVKQYQDRWDSAGYIEATELFNVVPLNTAGIHTCVCTKMESMIINACVALMPYRTRVKSKVHLGSHVECQYLLATYGITKGALPLRGANHDMDLTYWNTWFQQRKIQEQREHPSRIQFHRNSSSMESSSIASQLNKNNNAAIVSHGPMSSISGNENDVLCLGRIVKRMGNERLHSLGLLYATAYDNGSVADRRKIVNGIIDEIHRHGGRFLKPDSSSDARSLDDDESPPRLKELSLNEQRTKVMQLFRNLRRRQARGNGPVSTAPALAESSSSSSVPATSSSALPALTPSGTLAVSSETSPQQPPMIVSRPNPEDVLFGQQNENPGNQLLRELVGSLSEEYNRAGRGEKKKIAAQLANSIHESGGRFLKPMDDGRWEIAPFEVACDKISKHFRNIRRKR